MPCMSLWQTICKSRWRVGMQSTISEQARLSPSSILPEFPLLPHDPGFRRGRFVCLKGGRIVSRLASAVKGGFYPLPPVVTELILTHLVAPQGGRILDPCAGEGDALATL